jgi:four helix bundle protein
MVNGKINSFTDLKTWQEGHKLVICVYRITKTFPKEETYSLIDQMRRASASVTANIAEGFGRKTYKEKLHFYYISQGSLTELKNFILIARDVGYLQTAPLDELIQQANHAHRLLQGLITKTKSFIS